MHYEIRYLIASPLLLALYVQYVAVYRLRNSRWTLPLAVIWVPLGLAFAAQNIAFNAVVGSFIFWERPRQWFFSDRIRASTPDRQERYKRLLNPHDKGHI